MMRRVLSCIVALLALFVFSQTVRAQRFQEPCWIISTPARSRAVISSDGSYVLAASGSSIFLIAANSGQLLWKKDLGAEVWAISINKNGDYLVAGGEDNLISCFSRDGSFLWSFNTEGQVNAIAISADGKYVVASSTGGWIYLLDSGSLVWSRQFQATLVYTIAISEDGWYIAVGTYEPAGIYLFHRSSANPVWDYIPNNFPTSLAFSASGAYLTAGCADNSVYLFSSTSSTPLWVYPTDHIVSSVAISGDGMTIAAGSLGGKVYSLSQSGALKWSYLTGEDVVSVALSRDGSRLVSTGSQGTVHFFTDGKLHWLTRRKDECYSSLSSTGEFVVIAGFDNQIALYRKNLRPELGGGTFSPTFGDPSTLFTFSLNYLDPDGDEPSYVKLVIDNQAKEMCRIEGSYENAKYNLSLYLPPGLHFYWFEASDGVYIVRFPENGSLQGPKVRRITTLEVSPKSFFLDLGENLSITACLRSDGEPLEGKTIRWRTSQGTLSASETLTDTTGTTVVSFRAPSTPASVLITASFDGDEDFTPASENLTGTIKHLRQTVLILTPENFSLEPGKSIVMQATLSADGIGLKGKTLRWSTSLGILSSTATLTDSSGRAFITYWGTRTGETLIKVYFEGDENYSSSCSQALGFVKFKTYIEIEPQEFRIGSCENLILRIRLLSDNGPLPRRTLRLTVSEGEITQHVQTEENGETLATFIAPPSVTQVKINVLFDGEDRFLPCENYVVGDITFRAILTFLFNGKPLANTTIYYGEHREPADKVLGVTDEKGTLILSEKVADVLYLKTEDGKTGEVVLRPESLEVELSKQKSPLTVIIVGCAIVSLVVITAFLSRRSKTLQRFKKGA